MLTPLERAGFAEVGGVMGLASLVVSYSSARKVARMSTHTVESSERA
jgi:hypothetical protein